MISQFSEQYAFLSNFWPCKINYEGTVYDSAEHAYQAAKSLLPWERQCIAAASTPGKAKRMGRKVTLRPDWDDVKIQVMSDIVSIKFQDQELAEMLLATGDEELVEGNHWNDTFWGICRGQGTNWLGKILMQVRAKLQ